MSIAIPTTIEVITRENEEDVRGVAVELISKQLDVHQLRQKFYEFIGSLQSIIDIKLAENCPFELNEIQFSAEIGANGDFKLLGTGIGLDSKSGVTFVLRRKITGGSVDMQV